MCEEVETPIPPLSVLSPAVMIVLCSPRPSGASDHHQLPTLDNGKDGHISVPPDGQNGTSNPNDALVRVARTTHAAPRN